MKGKYLSTAQVAKLCNVTRHTIINWVNNGRLKSNKTIGGHRRISREDLLKFIKENKIVNIYDGQNKDLIPRCWEFRGFRNSKGHNCTKCLVFQEKAEKCFLLVKKFGASTIQCKYDCLNCAYLMEYYPKEREIIKAEVLKGVDKSVQKKGVLVPPCWRFKNFIDSDKHDCDHCLVFKKKADKSETVIKKRNKIVKQNVKKFKRQETQSLQKAENDKTADAPQGISEVSSGIIDPGTEIKSDQPENN